MSAAEYATSVPARCLYRDHVGVVVSADAAIIAKRERRSVSSSYVSISSGSEINWMRASSARSSARCECCRRSSVKASAASRLSS